MAIRILHDVALPSVSANFLEFLSFPAQLPELFLKLVGKRDELGNLEKYESHCEKDI